MSLEGSQLGHYRLSRQIGSGGMGEIYLAEDTRIARQVAVKVVRNEPASYPDSASIQESTRLFRREMKAVASLDNPHILTLLDFGEELLNGITITYMVMPYRPEGSLNDWMIRRSEKLSLEEINNIIQQAADALQHAHDNGIIHQDVKPSNFLIRGKKDKPNHPDLLLADFGIAKILGATSTASQTSRGTATFMPPEQWDGQPVAATDQYALAVMAYLLLTGRTPFQGRLEQVMRQHFMTEPAAPSTFNPTISADVDKVILHALAKKPEERFASVSNFANALQQALLHSKQTPPLQKPLEPTVYAFSGPVTPQDVHVLAPTVLASSGTSTPPDAIAENVKNTPPPLPPSRPLPSTSPKSRTRIFVLVGLALLIGIAGIIGIATYQNNVYQSNVAATMQANDANATATAIVVAANPYPSYLAGSDGTLALLDDSLGSCHDVNESQVNSFNPCYISEAMFSNFAFEVQMTITRGDCGGMLFRVDQYKLYYYQICQDEGS